MHQNCVGTQSSPAASPSHCLFHEHSWMTAACVNAHVLASAAMQRYNTVKPVPLLMQDDPTAEQPAEQYAVDQWILDFANLFREQTGTRPCFNSKAVLLLLMQHAMLLLICRHHDHSALHPRMGHLKYQQHTRAPA